MKLITVLFLIGFESFCFEDNNLVISKKTRTYFRNNVKTISNEFEKLLEDNGKSMCAKKALNEVVPLCQKNGLHSISSLLRKKTALKLSICEFESTGINYPKTCMEIHKNEECDRCILELEKSPQSWTTFSGYYRELNKICYEQMIPYEKDQIIQLYYNITLIYKTFIDDLRKTNDFSEKIQETVSDKFNDFFIVIDKILDEKIFKFKKSESMFGKAINDYNKNVESVLKDTLVIIKDLCNDFDMNRQEIYTHLGYFSSEIKNLADSFSDVEFLNKFKNFKTILLDHYNSMHESSDIVSEKLMKLTNDLQLFSLVSENQTKRIAMSLSATETLSVSLNKNLLLNNDLVTNQVHLFKLQLENFSTFFESEFDTLIKKNNLFMESYLNRSFNKIEMRIEKYKKLFDLIDSSFNLIHSRLKNVIIPLNDGISWIYSFIFSNPFRVLFMPINLLMTKFSKNVDYLIKVVIKFFLCLMFSIVTFKYFSNVNKTKTKTKTKINFKFFQKKLLNIKLFSLIITNIIAFISILTGFFLAFLLVKTSDDLKKIWI